MSYFFYLIFNLIILRIIFLFSTNHKTFFSSLPFLILFSIGSGRILSGIDDGQFFTVHFCSLIIIFYIIGLINNLQGESFLKTPLAMINVEFATFVTESNRLFSRLYFISCLLHFVSLYLSYEFFMQS